jgi:GNAT superfamily N-acetyltransferase
MTPEIHPLAPDRWDDLVELFGERGAYGGCWCMFFRLSRRDFDEGTATHGELNRRRLRALTREGRVPGLLAYVDGRPVGWCSVAPRGEFGRIERSKVAAPIDDRPAWSVVCFYLDRRWRAKGVGTALLRAAVDHARAHGARLIEGYPVDPAHRRYTNAEAYTGTVPMFVRAGFREVARRSPGTPIMRRTLRARRA